MHHTGTPSLFEYVYMKISNINYSFSQELLMDLLAALPQLIHAFL